MDIVSVKDVAVRGRRVLLRVDFNVPIEGDGTISDDTRIREALPTIRYLQSEGARTVIMSHLGRPGGKKVHRFSLAPVARKLGELLGRDVPLVEDIVGPGAQSIVEKLPEGGIIMLENVRFHREEQENDRGFSRQLARLGDLFVNDAFGTAHRAHASTHGLARELPAVAGLLMHREITALRELRDGPQSPYVAVIGGAKISDKLSVCRRLLDRVDGLLVGGGLANTFLLTMGYDVGNSLVEPDMVREVRTLIAEASRKNVDLMMPLDVVVANTISPSAITRVVEASSVPRGWSIVDIGPRTVARYSAPLAEAKTIFWNGPMGVMEVPAFSRGTEGIARAIASQKDAHTVAGGGESVEMLSRLKLSDRLDHISTGGGAALQYLAGDALPALSLLERTGTRRRRPWVGGNWKMSVPSSRARVLARAVAEGVAGDDVDVVIFPSHTQIEGVAGEIGDSRLLVGGQDCHWETEGSFTSGVSGAMLGEAGARCTLVGHSECRRYLGDDDDRVASKLRTALASDLVAILCFGEESRAGEDGGWKTIERQLRRALEGLKQAYGDEYPWSSRLLLAYEPVWAIGSGEPASPETVADTTSKIREELGHIFDPWAAEEIRLVYGGSVNADNAADFVALPSVDGVLVGGASTSAESFLGIVEAVRESARERDE